MSSKQLDDINDKKWDNHIAGLLGISVEEFQSLEHGGIEDETSGDGLVYRHYMQFSDDSPREILDKIKGLDETNTVYFDTASFM